MKESLGRGLRRFVVVQLRDTRGSIAGKPVSSAVARQQLKEQFQVWWVDLGIPAKLEVVTARLRPLQWRWRR